MEIHSERKKRLSLSLLFKIIKDTVWGFIDDSVMRLSASLAYATLFSIILRSTVVLIWIKYEELLI